MSALRLLLAGLLAAFGLVVLTPIASFACSCAGGEAAEYVEWADVVFAGTLTNVEPPPEHEVMSSTDPVAYTFEVDRVLSGSAEASTVVESAALGASCGLEGLAVGKEYVVFAYAEEGGLAANLCGGTQPARAGFVAEVEAVTGPGQPPAAPTSTATPTDPADPADPLPWLAQVLAVVLDLLGLSE